MREILSGAVVGRSWGSVDLGIIRHRCTGLNPFQQSSSLPMQPLCIDVLPGGQVASEFAQSFAELTTSAGGVAALAMIETNCHVNQRLQEQPARPTFRSPSLLQHFVALEKLAVIEKRDSPAQQLIHLDEIVKS
jgi:hypothetical protein